MTSCALGPPWNIPGTQRLSQLLCQHLVQEHMDELGRVSLFSTAPLWVAQGTSVQALLTACAAFPWLGAAEGFHGKRQRGSMNISLGKQCGVLQRTSGWSPWRPLPCAGSRNCEIWRKTGESGRRGERSVTRRAFLPQPCNWKRGAGKGLCPPMNSGPRRSE